jgi:DNA polymerase III subunit chi
MTQVDFHTGVAQPLHYGARLVRKALQRQQALVLLCRAEQAAELESAVLSLEPEILLPLCGAAAAPAVMDRSLVVIAQNAQGVPARGWLVNLTQDWPHGFEAFEKVIEVVATDETAVLSGRQRWGQYKTKGYPLEHRQS